MQTIIEKKQSTENPLIDRITALEILEGKISLPDTVHRASLPRFEFFGKKVRIHILDNVKNGHCSEDCGYCAQRKNANSGVQEYPMKSEEEILQEARAAKDNGAYRFCIVSAGTGPNDRMVERLSGTISKITNEIGLKVCLSAGLLDKQKAQVLKEAGLDRYNHNLNTSEAHYGEICTTHTFQDRLKTIEHLNVEGIGICSGLIVGMGETFQDLVDVAFTLKKLKIISIPINFFIPIFGHAIKNPSKLTPELCIRILSMFRLVNPDSEIRVAAGREGHLRSLQSMSLFVANSLFASGYLNVQGSEIEQTVSMILDAGFEPDWEDADFSVEPNSELYSKENIQNLYKFRKKN